MGYSHRNNGQITDFQPDDTDDEFYLEANWISVSLSEILERAQQKWPGITIDQIEIEAKHIHTRCLTYDLHDPSDYTNFLCITRNKNG